MKIKLIFFFIISFGFSLLYYLPASFVLPLVSHKINASFTGIEGRIWDAKIQRVKIKRIDLGKVHWTVQPAALLDGLAQLKIKIDSPKLMLNGLVGLNFDKTIHLDKFNFNFDSSRLRDFNIHLPMGVQLAGLIQGDIPHLEWQKAHIPLATGKINWQDGTIKSSLFGKLPTGNYKLTIKPEGKKQLVAILQAENAPLDIQGKIHLKPIWLYQANLKIKPNKNTTSQIKNGLAMLGVPQPDGSINIKYEGSLPPPKFPL